MLGNILVGLLLFIICAISNHSANIINSYSDFRFDMLTGVYMNSFGCLSYVLINFFDLDSSYLSFTNILVIVGSLIILLGLVGMICKRSDRG